MTLAEPLIEELQHESLGTRKILERIPADKLGWQPHTRSMTLGRLAAHIAEIPGWLHETIRQDELDFAITNFTPFPLDNKDLLMSAFEAALNKGMDALKHASDENLMAIWRLRNGPHVFLQMPRIGIVRGLILNHVVHHRGQLSVYLRLLDLQVPGLYGPSADE